jgi:hypothetical protein
VETPVLKLALLTLLLAPLAVMSPASAASYNVNGHLEVRGYGTSYTTAYPPTSSICCTGSSAAMTVPSGGSATYSFKVDNKGTTASQYWLISHDGDQTTSTVRIGTASGKVVALEDPNTRYLTPTIDPGGSLTYFVKVQVAKGAPQGGYGTSVGLLPAVIANPNQPTYPMDTVGLDAEVKAPAAGADPTEVFVRNGGGYFVGGSLTYQTAGAPALKPGASTTFTVQLRNNGPAATKVSASVANEASCADGFAVSFASGTVGVSAVPGGYSIQTPTLAKGQTKNYTLTVKRSGSDCGQVPRFYVYSGTVRVNLGVAPAVS